MLLWRQTNAPMVEDAATQVEDKRPIWYCWKDQRSQDWLEPILMQAITRWGKATQESSLSFELDQKDALLCNGGGFRADASLISDETREGSVNDFWNNNLCATQITTGYDCDNNHC